MKQATRKPTTVGDTLLYEYLEPLNLKINELAEMLHVHRNSISALVNNKRKLTTDMAFRLSKAFDTTVDFWLNIQAAVDLWEIENDMRAQEEFSRIMSVKIYLDNRNEQHSSMTQLRQEYSNDS
ncbi:HigA family addiction module antitoxin (plasmid) [Raoultella ornithinolytica]|uniref:HigA family addiction module antitoxin n=1 Tax=Raoultella ornithinolytica TaxID=54291 RepID=UPI00292BAA20|nr:HigA family addiction module antitoxin [Raoultella ornithinolytica]MDV1094981.1 HigA family addiction module antitoxin [Raoultella ornithinolytica]MDV1122675.1 HigA family addiction module antitoxin [Raoultella ornithinolytica]MDV1893190.1 HigA family addiction module antitoxin [Raoultella ornithinolytica]